MKICTKCKKEKTLENFSFRLDSNKYRNQCKYCRNEQQREYVKNNKIRIYAKRREFYIQHPWMQSYRAIKHRCNNSNASDYKYYGGRGIKCLITRDEIKKLWFRDKACELKKPSIDRIDNDGHYTYTNCRFIEQSLNSIKRNQKK